MKASGGSCESFGRVMLKAVSRAGANISVSFESSGCKGDPTHDTSLEPINANLQVRDKRHNELGNDLRVCKPQYPIPELEYTVVHMQL